MSVIGLLLVLAALAWPLGSRVGPHWMARGVTSRRVAGSPVPTTLGAATTPWHHKARARARRARGRLRSRSPARVDTDAADVADLAALGLEAGLPTEAALALATRGVAEVPPALAMVLALSEDLGAPVGASARSAAAVLRERARAREASATLAAGPRASMYLLTALPLLGPVGLAAMGLPLGSVYGTPLTIVLAGVGAILTALGWLAARGILRRAERPTQLRRPSRGGVA